MKPSSAAANMLARSCQFAAGPSRPRLAAAALGSSRVAITPHDSRSRLAKSISGDRPLGARTFFSLPDITKLATLVPGQDGESNGEEQRFHARKILP